MAVTPASIANVTKATESVVTEVTPTVAVNLKGFIATGTCEAKYTLYVGGVARYFYRTADADRNAYLLVPDDPVAANTAIQVRVIHQESNIQSFDATIITS